MPHFRPGSVAISVEDSSWFAVQTKPRHEKRVSLELAEKGLHSFLPLHRTRRRWSDRYQWLELPLFSQYVFVRMASDAEVRTRVLRTVGVVRLAGAPGHGTPVPEEQIESLQAMVELRIPLMPHSHINVGERVRICGGALNGVEGVLVSIKDARRLVVSVDLIQRSVAVQLDGFEVERA
jgi:transcription antitermination factor NusG